MPSPQLSTVDLSETLQDADFAELVYRYTVNRLRLQQLAQATGLLGVDADVKLKADEADERAYQEGELLDEQADIFSALFGRVPQTRIDVDKTMSFYSQAKALGEFGDPDEGSTYAEMYLNAVHTALVYGLL